MGTETCCGRYARREGAPAEALGGARGATDRLRERAAVDASVARHCPGGPGHGHHQKSYLEYIQRTQASERKVLGEEWEPRMFERDPITGDWVYKHVYSRPWDPHNDVAQFENNFVVQSKTRHRTPLVRATSIMSVEDKDPFLKRTSLNSLKAEDRLKRMRRSSHLRSPALARESGSSTPDGDHQRASESSDSDGFRLGGSSGEQQVSAEALEQSLEPLVVAAEETNRRLVHLARRLEGLARRDHDDNSALWNRDWWIVVVILLFQAALHYIFNRPVGGSTGSNTSQAGPGGGHVLQ